MMLTTKGRYAVMAMVDLAYYSVGGQVTALHEVADRQEIAINYLEQLFSKLKKANLVEAIKGPGGGYKLSRSPKDISILEVINAVNESIKITRCDNKTGCLIKRHNKICFTHALWDGLSKQIGGYLDSMSLQDVSNNIRVNDGALWKEYI